MTRFIKVATTDELEDEQAKLVEVEGQKMALLYSQEFNDTFLSVYT